MAALESKKKELEWEAKSAWKNWSDKVNVLVEDLGELKGTMTQQKKECDEKI